MGAEGPRRLMKGPWPWLPLSARKGSSERVTGLLERMKCPEAPSNEKELPSGPPDSTEEDPELPEPLSAWPGPLGT